MHHPSLLVPLLAALALSLSACDGGSAFEAVDGPGGEQLPDGGDEDAALPDPCPPPADPNKAALCVTIEPEAIDFIQGDQRFDGEGILQIALFNKALPGLAPPLQDETLPPQGVLPEAKRMAELVAEPIRFELEAGTVYPRVLFFDDLGIFEGVDAMKKLPGMWLGGFDTSRGLIDQLPLQPVVLEAGEGKELSVKLLALRQLTVTVLRGDVARIGNGEGPLHVIAFDSPNLVSLPGVYGLAESCESLSLEGSSVKVEGVVLGEGPYWVAAILDDFGEGWQSGAIPAGSLFSFSSAGVIPTEDQLSYPATAYRVAKDIKMINAMMRMDASDSVLCE